MKRELKVSRHLYVFSDRIRINEKRIERLLKSLDYVYVPSSSINEKRIERFILVAPVTYTVIRSYQ